MNTEFWPHKLAEGCRDSQDSYQTPRFIPEESLPTKKQKPGLWYENKWAHPYIRNHEWPRLYTFYKNQLTMMTEPNEKYKTKFLEDNMGSNLIDFVFGDYFLETTWRNNPRGSDGLDQWFSTFLMLQPVNIVPHVAVILNHKLFHCYFITIIVLLWITI